MLNIAFFMFFFFLFFPICMYSIHVLWFASNNLFFDCKSLESKVNVFHVFSLLFILFSFLFLFFENLHILIR